MSILPTLPTAPGPANATESYQPAADFLLEAGAYLRYLDQSRMLYFGAPNFVNRGSIFFDIAYEFGGVTRVAANGQVQHIDNSGLMVFHAHGPALNNVQIFDEFRSFVNSGEIYGWSDSGSARLLQTYYSQATITNSGLLAVHGGIGPYSAIAISLPNGAIVRNLAGGRILAEGDSAIAISMAIGSIEAGYDIDNAGHIEARGIEGGSELGIGIYLGVGDILNTGSIAGDIAVMMNGRIVNSGTISGTVAIASMEFTTIVNEATGVITGDIAGGNGDNDGFIDRIENHGLITGNIALGNGDDLIVNLGTGAIDGIVDLGFGDDHYTGSGGVDRVAGDNGDDRIDGGGGNDLLLGGNNNDTLTGGAGNDGLYGENGDDVIHTSGGDAAFGGNGNDRIVLGDLSFARAMGGAGSDTLVLAPGARTLDLAAAIASGRIGQFEVIELVGSQGIVVREGDATALAGGTLRIDGTASDSVTLVGGWTANGTVSVGGVDYLRYVLGGAAVLVEPDVVATVAATAPAGATGLDAVASGDAALEPGEASGLFPTPNTLFISAMEVRTDAHINMGEIWWSEGKAPALWSDVPGVVLTNDGRLLTTNSAQATAVAIQFLNSGYIVNNGWISAQSFGAIEFPVPGYFPQSREGAYGLRAAFSLVNNGTVDAYSARGVAVGAGEVQVTPPHEYNMETDYILHVFSSVPRIDNRGEINAIADNGYAFGTVGSVEFENSGEIFAAGRLGAVGAMAGGVVVNSGRIEATSDTWSAGLVYLYSGAEERRVTNSGTIMGQVAIRVDAHAEHDTVKLTLNNSGLIQGRIEAKGADDRIDNRGTIVGDVLMGRGADIFDGSAGVQSGWVFGEQGDDRLTGGAGNDRFDGGDGDDWMDLSLGGVDHARGGAGNDAFFFGAAFTTADVVDGGAGSNDQLGLQGNYTGGTALNLGAGNVTGVEVITLLGGAGNGYAIVTADDMIAGGGVATFFGTNLAAGNGFTFDGSAETDGGFRIYGGAGIDLIVTGGGNDGIWFGPNRFDPASDRVNGGAGIDQLALDGVYDLILDGNVVQGIEVLTLQAGAGNSFTLTALDNFVAAGAAGTIWGLLVTGGISIDLRAETDGHYRVFGGRGGDGIIGGAGDDWIFGGDGADFLAGAGGADTFFYDAVSQSTGAGFDTITGFDSASDRIDLPFALTGIAATVTGGSVSLGSFDADLAALLGAGQLGAGQALLFAADGGGLAGSTFLVVDANGVAGYQAGEDYVIRLLNPPDDLRAEAFV